MLQIIQYQKTGKITVEELPAQQLQPGGVLVRNVFSLISAGTERSSVETAQASMLGKVRSRPDLVRQVIDNLKREGLVATYHKVQNRLDNYKDLGYSSAGTVIASSCDEFKAGDRVACAGVGYAAHAEVISVPKNLAVRIPDGVTLEDAAFTTLGAIALQGVRQADVHVGEHVVVVGLGLLGLITVQMLKASGCAVFGLDIVTRNFQLARKLGCDEVAINGYFALRLVESFTRGYGADAVIITAATKFNEPIEFAAQCARKKGKVVVVGVVGMDIPRSPAYEKELEFRMSCSYGPGRYDSEYEICGHDYPHGYVRWTENRNMEAALDLIAQRKLDVRSLVTHTFAIGDALKAYDVITGKTAEPHLGILISYPRKREEELSRKLLLQRHATAPASACGIGVIGAGNHVQSYLLPPLCRLGASLQIVAASKPVNAQSAGKKFGFCACTTDAAELFSDPAVNLVLIGTRHDTHAHFVVDALHAGKHVFVEKPLALTAEELDEIMDAYNEASVLLMVGYNRRFSAPVQALKQFVSMAGEPLALTYRVNAGFIPKSNWYQNPRQGGRVIGEVGHFLDTMQFITGSLPASVYAIAPEDPGLHYCNDNVQISLTFLDGSVGQIVYLANGGSAMGKEYLEVFGGGKSAVLDNFKRLTLFDGRKQKSESFDGDKGHAAETKAVLDSVRTGQATIDIESLVATSRASFAIIESLRSRAPVFLS